MDSFEPWLGRVERFSRAQLGEIAATIPPEWYNDEYGQLEELIRRLERRRQGVRELIAAGARFRAPALPELDMREPEKTRENLTRK